MLVPGHPQERPVDVSRASYAKCSAVRGCVGYADRSEAASQPLMPFCFPEPLAEKAMRFLRKPRNYAGLSL